MNRKSQQGQKVMCALTMFSAITRLEDKNKTTLALKSVLEVLSLNCGTY